LYPLSNIIRGNKPTNRGWIEYVARMRNISFELKILVGNPEF
jgi:hypothetical protein